LRKRAFLFFAKRKRLKPSKIRSIQSRKEVNEMLKRYTAEHLEKKYIEKVKRLLKIMSLILIIFKAMKEDYIIKKNMNVKINSM
jgi:hypothetical protein